METLISAFSGTLAGVLKVFLIIFAAGILVRLKIITTQHITGLTAATVNVFLPCLIFSNLTQTFDYRAFPIWWVLPLSAVLMVAFGLAAGSLFFNRELSRKKNMLALCSIQNSGYLVLPVGQALFPQQFDTFANYTFLYLLVFGIFLWSLGKHLITTGEKERISWKGLTTPPLAANFAALAMVFTGLNRYIPGFAADSIEMLGNAAVPVANFILGAILGGITLHLRRYLGDALKTTTVKLILLPLATIAVLYILDVKESYPLMGSFLVLQSAAAPATGLILMVREYGGDENKISSLMFFSYLVCMFLMPAWISVWNCI
jgi:malate permease and related proteins